jgi:molybdate/tungstate transport system permease protein
MKILKIISVFLALLISLPVLLLIYLGLFVYRSPQAFSSQFLNSILLTFISSFAAIIIIFFLFTPLAYYLARENDSLINSLVDIPASIPHPIVGIALILIESPVTPIGVALNSMGIRLFDTFLGLTSALVIVSAPVYIKTAKSYFDSMSRWPEIFSLSLGVSRLKTFIFIVLPLSIKGLLNATLVSMARAISEFGSVAIISYYILDYPFTGSSPASVLIYEYFNYYGVQVAVTSSSILIVIGLVMNLATRIVERLSIKELQKI